MTPDLHSRTRHSCPARCPPMTHTPPHSYADVLAAVTDPVVVVQHGTVTFANPAFSELTGVADPVGAPIRSFAPQDTASDLDRFCDAVAAGNATRTHARVVLAGADTDRRLVTVDATRLNAAHQDAPATALVVVAAPESGMEWAHHERILDALPVGSFRTRLGDGVLLGVNDELVAFADAPSKAALRGRPATEFYATPAAREEIVATLRADGVVTETELELETLAGNTVWGTLTAVTVTHDGTTVVDGAIRDVTERRQLETELRQRARRFRRMFKHHSAPMLLIDPDSGGIQNANDAAAAFYGYSVSELTGMTVTDLNTLPSGALDTHRGQAEEGDRNHFVFEHELADGERRTVEIHSSPIELDTDTVLFSIVVDVTERADYEARLETQRDNLDVLNQVLRHDIRNDLQLVLAYADMLAGELDGEHADYIERVLESADHAVELTKTARDIADVMLTDPDADHVMSLRATLKAELAEVRSSFPSAAVTVDGSIPDVTVHGNNMLDSVFRNLLKNAIQHNDQDSPEVTVSADCTDDNTATIHVADNGPGVPDAQKDAIFGKGETGLDSDGTGMGLYLVDTLVDSVGGRVTVSDNDPTGAVFSVTLRTGP
ncbi:PAS domain S-box protein [Halobacterium salinarum]|nr:PAS domain S-box protein [Halobacterium salinarum]QRY23746.1 PAS domain S-box protein [Halobacterium sp. GSL-19]